MSTATSEGELFKAWAQREPTLTGLILTGSRLWSGNEVWGADRYSDWDWQAISRRPGLFDDVGWLEAAGLPQPLVYVNGRARLGNVAKIYLLFPRTEMEVVIYPHRLISVLRIAVICGGLRRSARLARMMAPVAAANRPGYALIKGEARWSYMFERILAEVPTDRLDDDHVHRLGDGFVFDYITVLRRLNRGESHSAQRLLHLHLMETNYRLFHELQLRLGRKSFPDARRLHLLADEADAALLKVDSHCSAEGLREAVEHSARACRELMRRLLGEAWRWPDLSGR